MMICLATEEHLDRIESIENSSFSDPWSKSNLLSAIRSDNISVFIAVNDENIVIAFSCLLIIDYEAEILNIAVSENYRRCGVGRLLVSYMLNVCRVNNISHVFLEVRQSNHKARGLYNSCGFEEIGIRKRYYVNPQEDAVLMKLQLSDVE